MVQPAQPARQDLLAQQGPLAQRALLDLLARPESSVLQALQALSGLLAQQVTSAQQDRKVFKVISAQRDRKAYRVFRAPKVSKARPAQQVHSDQQASKARLAQLELLAQVCSTSTVVFRTACTAALTQ